MSKKQVVNNFLKIRPLLHSFLAFDFSRRAKYNFVIDKISIELLLKKVTKLKGCRYEF